MKPYVDLEEAVAASGSCSGFYLSSCHRCVNYFCHATQAHGSS